MNVLHIIGSLDPATGGPPVVVMRLAAAQTALGCRVEVLSYDSIDTAPAIEEAASRLPDIARVKRHVAGSFSMAERLLGTGSRAVLKRLIADAGFVHLHGVWETLLKSAATIARRMGVPYAVVPHGMLSPWNMAQKPLKKRIALELLGFRPMIDNAAFIHALNDDEKQLLKARRFRSPVEVIPNGMFLSEVDPLPSHGTFRAAHPELGRSPYVVFLSRLQFKKGLDFLADAFAIVARARPDVRLAVIGPDEGSKAGFVEQVRQAGLLSRVHLLGPVYGVDKFAALVDAACFCLPSRQEGFSVAILEAMAARTPVVISDACHFPEVAAAGAGEVVPLSADHVAAALLRVLGDAQTARSMGQAGRSLVESRFTWERIAERTLAMYQKYSAKRRD